MAKLYRDHTHENSINQSNSGVSLLNFQWASFASGASALGVVALICASIILCCLWKAKAGRRRLKNQERLLKAISSPANECSFTAPRTSVSTTAPAPIAGSGWIRTPTGWTSIPSSYGAGSSGVPRLPYPQFPPLLYDGDFSRCGYPSCRQAIKMRTFPAVAYNAGTPYGTMSRFTEIRDEDDRDWRSESSRPPRRRSPGRREPSPRPDQLCPDINLGLLGKTRITNWGPAPSQLVRHQEFCRKRA